VKFKKGSSLCVETFDTEICRPVRCGFCDSGSSQRRLTLLRSRVSIVSWMTSVVSTSQRSSVNDVRKPSHDQVRRQVTGLHDQSRRRECVLLRTHSSKASQVPVRNPSMFIVVFDPLYHDEGKLKFRCDRTSKKVLYTSGKKKDKGNECLT
jgi:hypothetical protein